MFIFNSSVAMRALQMRTFSVSARRSDKVLAALYRGGCLLYTSDAADE